MSYQHDDHAVDIMKDGTVVGHMPCYVLKVSWFSLRRGSKITCRLIGRRKLGVGLEVPCVYLYAGPGRMTRKLGRLYWMATMYLYLCPVRTDFIQRSKELESMFFSLILSQYLFSFLC